jgi:hypothetical protein
MTGFCPNRHGQHDHLFKASKQKVVVHYYERGDVKFGNRTKVFPIKTCPMRGPWAQGESKPEQQLK